MEYVPLLNMATKGNLECVLVGPPQPVDMHWDNEEKRTQICSGDDCHWCLKEQAPRGYFYAPCVYVKVCEDHQEWVKAIVQLPMGFVANNEKRLVSGRRVSVQGLHVEGKTPFWQSGGLIDPPCEAFDVVEVLCRIKGIKKAKAPEIKKFPRIGEVG